MRRAVILSAGKAIRLGGRNKLLAEAGGIPVHEWHRRLLVGIPTAVVVPSKDREEILAAMPWVDRVVAHDQTDGPVGALRAYLNAYDEPKEMLVLFADTLLSAQPLPLGDWVGVAPAPARRWDFPVDRGIFSRGELLFPVCVGIYAFGWSMALREAADEAIEDGAIFGERDVPMIRLLNRYQIQMHSNPIRGWYDAGDPEAIARVPAYEEVKASDPESVEIGGMISVKWKR